MGTSTNPSAICQISSASMLAALAQYSISGLYMAGGPECITIKLVLMYTLKENYRQVKTQEVQERQSSQLVGTQELLRTTILLKQ